MSKFNLPQSMIESEELINFKISTFPGNSVPMLRIKNYLIVTALLDWFFTRL